jgi:hypothetical protein
VLGIFLLAILFFLLPWMSVSCAGEDIIQVSGLDMVTGSYNVPDESISSGSESELFAILALISAIIGLVACLIRHKVAFFTRVISGIAGIAFLVLLKLKIDNNIFDEGQGILQVNYLIGYWLTLLAFVTAIIVSILRLGRHRH